jgi:hypothetical protein
MTTKRCLDCGRELPDRRRERCERCSETHTKSLHCSAAQRGYWQMQREIAAFRRAHEGARKFRPCLKCGRSMMTDMGHRLCPRCTASNANEGPLRAVCHIAPRSPIRHWSVPPLASDE